MGRRRLISSTLAGLGTPHTPAGVGGDMPQRPVWQKQRPTHHSGHRVAGALRQQASEILPMAKSHVGG
jgi:uncharacterized protein YbbK (DUF523 family)